MPLADALKLAVVPAHTFCSEGLGLDVRDGGELSAKDAAELVSGGNDEPFTTTL